MAIYQGRFFVIQRDVVLEDIRRQVAAGAAHITFGDPDFFPLPEPLIGGPAPRVMSLRDGTKKMSKSDPSEYSRINLSDGPDEIAQKIRRVARDAQHDRLRHRGGLEDLGR